MLRIRSNDNNVVLLRYWYVTNSSAGVRVECQLAGTTLSSAIQKTWLWFLPQLNRIRWRMTQQMSATKKVLSTSINFLFSNTACTNDKNPRQVLHFKWVRDSQNDKREWHARLGRCTAVIDKSRGNKILFNLFDIVIYLSTKEWAAQTICFLLCATLPFRFLTIYIRMQNYTYFPFAFRRKLTTLLHISRVKC